MNHKFLSFDYIRKAHKNCNFIQASVGEGRYKINIDAVRCGRDLSVTITGGTAPHVGAVAIGIGRLPDERPMQYSATVSTFTVPDHKDDAVARMAAKELADALCANVTVTCGIHIDDAVPDELVRLQENVKLALEQLLLQMQHTQ